MKRIWRSAALGATIALTAVSAGAAGGKPDDIAEAFRVACVDTRGDPVLARKAVTGLAMVRDDTAQCSAGNQPGVYAMSWTLDGGPSPRGFEIYVETRAAKPGAAAPFSGVCGIRFLDPMLRRTRVPVDIAEALVAKAGLDFETPKSSAGNGKIYVWDAKKITGGGEVHAVYQQRAGMIQVYLSVPLREASACPQS